MGRAKLNMELISNEKSRNTTLKKRKEGLIRKMHEFTTLCDVNACMIIYSPKHENGALEPEIWPQNVDQVHRTIDIYKSKNKDSGHKTFGVPDFFHERNRKIEDELAKLRRKNLEAKYPTAPELLIGATGAELREFARLLSNKATYVKSRVQMLRTNKQAATTSFYHPPAAAPAAGEFDAATFNHAINHHNSAMMLLMNENNHFESIQFKRQLFFESTGGYWPPPLPPPQPFTPPPQQLHFSDRDDFIQYQMRNHTSNNQDYNIVAWPQ